MTESQRYLAEEVAEDHADGIITRLLASAFDPQAASSDAADVAPSRAV